MRPFSETAAPYLIFNCKRNVFEILLTIEDGLAPKVHANAIGKSSASVRVKEKVRARVRERSAAVGKALRYATYLYLQNVNSLLTNNALYAEHKSWERWVIYKLQSRKLLRTFESLPDFVAAALGITKPESLNRALLELSKRAQIAEGRPHPEPLVSLLLKGKHAVLQKAKFGSAIVLALISPFSAR